MSTTSSIEHELKLSIAPDAALPDLREIVGASVRQPDRRFLTTYFDTRDLRLLRAGVTLRHRTREVDHPGTWTVKLPETGRDSDDGVLERTELEWTGEMGEPPLEARAVVRGIIRHEPLSLLLEMETVRQPFSLVTDDGVAFAELDDDHVSVHDGGSSDIRFREVELEFAPGAPEDAPRSEVISALQAAGARPEAIPKLRRALAATARAELADVSIGSDDDSSLGEHSSMDEVVRATLSASFDRYLRHECRLRLAVLDAEDVHQARVAIRRARSDLKTFRRILDPVGVARTRDELRWLGSALGAVRDTDVLASTIRAWSGPPELSQRVQRQRDSAAEALRSLLDSSRYLGLLDRLEATRTNPPYLGGQALGEAGGSASPMSREAPARDVLPLLLRSPLKKLRKQVKEAGGDAAAATLHRIRIRAKQLRYAAEAAAPVLGRDAERMARRAKKIQTELGDHHDLVMAVDWLEQTAATLPGKAAFVAGERAAELRRREAQISSAWWDDWRALDRKKVRAFLG